MCSIHSVKLSVSIPQHKIPLLITYSLRFNSILNIYVLESVIMLASISMLQHPHLLECIKEAWGMLEFLARFPN